MAKSMWTPFYKYACVFPGLISVFVPSKAVNNKIFEKSVIPTLCQYFGEDPLRLKYNIAPVY